MSVDNGELVAALRRVIDLGNAWVGFDSSHGFGDELLLAIGPDVLNALEVCDQCQRQDRDVFDAYHITNPLLERKQTYWGKFCSDWCADKWRRTLTVRDA